MGGWIQCLCYAPIQLTLSDVIFCVTDVDGWARKSAVFAILLFYFQIIEKKAQFLLRQKSQNENLDN